MKIEHDFHIHTGLSLCADEGLTAAQIIQQAQQTGMKKIGFSNHVWDEGIRPVINRFYRAQTVAYNCELKEELSGLDTTGLAVFFGAEAEYHPIYGVALTEEKAEQFDFILVPNSHTHMVMDRSLYRPYEKHADFMVGAYQKIIRSPISRYITAMAHPFDAVCCPYDKQILYRLISDDCLKRLFSETAERGIAVEINTAALAAVTPEQAEAFGAVRMLRIAKDMGCRFLFGSDVHSLKGWEGYPERAAQIGQILGLCEDDIAPFAKQS